MSMSARRRKNYREYKTRLDKMAEVPADIVGSLQRAGTMSLLTNVAQMTPVDAGRARGAWEVSQDEPPAALPPMPPSYPGGSAEARGQAAFADAVSRGAERAEAIRPFSRTYVSNRLPYIVPLNNGHSKQAPAGFVRMAMSVVRKTILAAQRNVIAAARRGAQ